MYESGPQENRYAGRTLYGDLFRLRDTIAAFTLFLIAYVIFTLVGWYQQPVVKTFNEHRFTRIVLRENEWTKYVGGHDYKKSITFEGETCFDDAMDWMRKNGYGEFTDPIYWHIEDHGEGEWKHRRWVHSVDDVGGTAFKKFVPPGQDDHAVYLTCHVVFHAGWFGDNPYICTDDGRIFSAENESQINGDDKFYNWLVNPVGPDPRGTGDGYTLIR